MSHARVTPEFESADDVRTEIKLRIHRFAQLRSVHRVLAPSIIALQEADQAQLGRTLREALGRLSVQAKDLTELTDGDRFLFTSGLDGIDRELDGLGTYLLECASGVGPAQMRSTVPRIVEQHPGEVLALLDLLIADGDALEGRLATIEYLITLLSTSERDGRRSICHDPAMLTDDLRALTAEIGARAEVDTASFELDLFQASSLNPADASTGELAREMRRRKQELGIDCLIPSTLRAIVTYNTRMFNRMHDDLEALRQSDEDLGGFGIEVGDCDSAIDADLGVDDWVEELGEDVDQSVPLEEAEGFALVGEALKRRLGGHTIGSCASERIALALDVESLEDEEREALAAGIEGAGDEALFARTVLIGLLQKDLAAFEGDLATLSIDPAALQTNWAAQLDELVKKRVSELLAKNAYDEACRLSEARTRHLYAPVSTLRRSMPRTAARGQASDRIAPVRETAGDGTGAALGRIGVLTGRRIAREEPPTRKPQRSPSRKRPVGRILLVAMAASALAYFSLNNGWTKQEVPELHELDDAELSTASRYVLSAYRDDHGEGGRLVGRLDPDWLELELADRVESAEALARQLSAEGVRDLILYDENHALQVHFVAGQLRVPRLLARSQPAATR